ncbi:MAG: FAD-dependent oxidoreductase [Patescibacteria group bacterium]|nr:FAD-dependent oxidoreductase [Patescibacteria group bacterium]
MELTLIEKKPETLSAVSFFFKPAIPVLWTPGQFLIYTLDHRNPDVRGKMRFFTISSAPFENHIAITTKIDDKSPSSFKKALNQMPIGGKIKAKGPDGNFVVEDVFAEYVFIAGGIGITPFRPIILDLTKDKSPIKVTLLYANKNGDILFKNELEEITKSNPNIKIHYFVSPVRIDRDSIKKLVSDLKKSLYYISGPNPMVEEMLGMLKTLGVEGKKIKSDYFDGYKAI